MPAKIRSADNLTQNPHRVYEYLLLTNFTELEIMKIQASYWWGAKCIVAHQTKIKGGPWRG